MSYQLEIDMTNEVLRAVFVGTVTDSEYLTSYRLVRRVVNTCNPRCAIADFSAVTDFPVSSSMVRQLADGPPLLRDRGVEITVAPNDSIFGMARMFQILANRNNIEVVRTPQEAYALIGLSAPDFRPLSSFK